MLAALLLFTNILWTMLLVIFTVMTRALEWEWCIHLVSASVKTMSSGSHHVLLVGRMSAL